MAIEHLDKIARIMRRNFKGHNLGRLDTRMRQLAHGIRRSR